MPTPENESRDRQSGSGTGTHKEHEISRAEAEKYADQYPILKIMLKDGEPITREGYIAIDYLEEPEVWTAENEMMLPPPFRHHE